MREETSAGSAQPVNASVQGNGDAASVQLAALDVSQQPQNAAPGADKLPQTVMAAQVTHVATGPDGVVHLPDGVTLESITVEGRDLVIHLPDGSVIVVDNGAIYVPQLVIGEVEIPAINLAALLIGNEPQPAAGGPSSSGGNFAVPVGDIGPGIGIGDLLPPTALQFGVPEFRQVFPGVENKTPSVEIRLPGLPDSATSVNEAGLPARGAESPGSDSASNSETAVGSIIYQPGDEPSTLTINNVAVDHVGQVIHGTFGDLTITSIAQGDIGFSYTLLDNTSGDNTGEDFPIAVVDRDGDTATANLHVDIIDDVPTARADVDSVGEDGPTVADGNVMTAAGGSDANSTDGVADTQGADGAHVTGVAAGDAGSASGQVGDAVAGSHGTLTLQSDGSYTYTLNAEDSAVNALNTGQHLTDTFTYTITDGDGDTSSTTLTITIDGSNDAPTITSGSAAVSEEGLAGGIADTAGTPDTTNSATASGDLTITDPDNSTFTVTLTHPSQALTSGGVAVTWTGDGTGTLIGSAGGEEVIRVTVSATGHYTVTLSGPVDHPTAGVEDALSIVVPVTVNDGSGGTDSSNITISIEDDSPTATVHAGSDSAVTMLTQDHDTIGAAHDTATADFSTVFSSTTAYGADGPGTTTTTYALSLAGAQGADSGLASNGAEIHLYDVGGVITGSTSATLAGVTSGNTIFTLSVNGSGVVTQTQYAEIDHSLPGASSNYDTQIASLGNGLVNLSATTTVVDADHDSATSSASIDLGGNVRFADDGPSVTVTKSSDAELSLTTQDHDTIGSAFDTATGDVSGLFTVVSNYGADGPGTNALTYSMTLLVAEGASSGLSSDGHTIYLYENASGVVVGSTSATEAGVTAGNTIFSLSVDGSGVVTSTQYAEIDHSLPGASSNYDSQIATLANGLVGVTASDTITDGDGDTAASAQTIDLGGNVHFADDGPSVTVRVSSDAEVSMLTQDHDTIGAAHDTSTANFGSLFTSVTSYGADGPGTTSTAFALSVTSQGEASGLSSDGHAIYLYDVSGVITGSTSATQAGVTSGNTIFTLSVDGSGVVTQTQYAEIDHSLPGASSNYDTQIASLGNDLVHLTGTTTVTDGDGDTATSSQSIDLGGNVNFADDGPSVTVTKTTDSGVVLTTQDHDTIGAAFDTATASVASVFHVTPTYGADGPGTTATTYSMTLLVAEGTSSGLASDGATIYLYETGGVVVGSTSATEAGVDAGNTIFSLSVDASGTVTSTQYAEIDHSLPGATSSYDTQLATLADGLVGVTASALTTDGDGDTATASQTVDLGGNVHFADDGPSVGTSAGSDANVIMLTQDHDTIGAAFDTATADFSSVFSATSSYGADGPGTTSTTYALSLSVAEGTASGLSSDGNAIYLYENGGVITGSTSATEAGVDAGNTIFTLAVDSAGVVTQTQYAEIDHGLPGDTSNYDSQVVSLANGLVQLSANTTVTDGDGDTASGSSHIDLGGNVQFADDGPSVTVRVSSDIELSLTTEDHSTIGAAFDTATGDVSGLFTVVSDYGADGAGTNSLTYSMTLLVAEGTSSGLASNGATIYLYENASGVVVGSTAATEAGVTAGNTIFTLEVDSSGTVTSTQYAEIDHSLPGSTSNYDSQIATLANGLVGVTASDTITDGDGDTATSAQTIDLGGNVHYADDGPSVSVIKGSDAGVSLTTQDHDTIGAAFDTATASVAGVFTVTPTYGADGPGTTTTAYAMTLLVAEGTSSGLASNGATIYLYENASGVVVGSTSATEAGVTAGNTIFSLSVDSAGLVTQTQYAEIDHSLPGSTSNYDTQIATLANGLVGVSATATTTDGDGDTATNSQTVDLGGNVHFADDGPSVGSTAGSDAAVTMLTQDHDTIGAAFDTATADFSSVFSSTSSYGADGPGTTSTTYALSLTVAEGTSSGFASNGATIYLFENAGVITGSTSATEAGVTAGNTIFTLAVDSAGVVTQTQYAEIDHSLPGSTSNYDTQVASLANGLVQLSATTTVTDGDGDTATGSSHIDLGGNVQFADDGPSVIVSKGSDTGVSLTTQDHDTIGAAFDTATASIASVFTVTPTYGADGPGTTTVAYSMSLLVAEGTSSGLASNGATIYLYENASGVVVGSTSATEAGVTAGNTIFSLSVDASGTVTSTQYAEIDHSLPGSTSNYDTQIATLANGLVGVTATATTTDGDGDTATNAQTVDLGGNVHYADDGPSVTVIKGSDAGVSLTTQDHDTIGSAFDTATASVASVFTVTPNYGADGPGTTTTAYSMSLLVAEGTSSGLASDGNTIYLFETGGVIVGSTSATEAGVTAGNTIFTLAVDSAGLVTQTQYAEIDHSLPGSTSNYDTQIATLANGLVGVTATATTTDGDGDTATNAQTVDLGGNVHFADDGPTATVGKLSDAGLVLTTQDHDTIGAATDTATASVAALFTSTTSYGADGPGTNSLTYSMTLLVAEGTSSGLSSDGNVIHLFETGGVIVGSTSATEAGVTAGNTIFTLSVDSAGLVTQTQYAEIDHSLPGDTSSYDTQLATLANGLVGVTATDLITDGDGDTATSSQTIDLGGNVNFADDGPTTSANSTVLLDDDALTGGNAGGGTLGGDDADSVNATGTLGHSYGADGAGTTLLTGASSLPTGFTSTVSNGGQTLTIYQGAVAVLQVQLSNTSGGAYTVTQLAPIDHPTVGTEDNLAFTVTYQTKDGDGDTANGSLTINVDDDSPVITSSSDITGMTGQTGTGDLVFSVGADHVATDDLTSYLTVGLSGSVGTGAISNVQVTADAVASTSGVAVYDISFDYAPNPAQPLVTVTETGTLTFDGTNYSIALDNAIESYSIATTSHTLSSVGYDAPGMAGGSDEIVVSQLATNFFVQFTGDHETGGAGGVPLTATGAAGSSTAYANGDLFHAETTSVSISGSANGVAGDTLQNGEVLDMDFYSSSPGSNTTLAPTASASEIFLKFDGIGATEDLVVILKLADPNNPGVILTTKAIVIDASDILHSGDTIPTGYPIVLDNNDGAVIIQSNDYNAPGENYVIVGAQLLSSTDGITGTGINLNGAVGAGGASTTTEAFGAITTDTDVIKISDIGFVATTTTTEALHLQLDVTVTDHDGDAVTQTVYVNPVAPPVALDLNGDGIQYLDQSAGVHFDYAGDGTAVSTAWVGPHDGLLAIDLNGDGKVTNGTEIVFATAGSTDLQGVAATYDTNHDGVLSAADADFAKFGVWQDANSNGIADAGEFHSLTEAGITSINLTTAEGSSYTTAGGQVVVNGTTTFTWANGSTGAVGDVSFATGAANDSTVEEAQRTFASTSAGYTSSPVAAGLIAAAATAFAHDVAPTLNVSGDVHTVSSAALATTPANVEAPTQSAAPVVDAFNGDTKSSVQSDASHPSNDSQSDESEHASVASAPVNHGEMSSLLSASDSAGSSVHAAFAPVFMDSVQMPMINASAMAPAAQAAAAPAAGQAAQVAEVLADALHGGATGAISIDHLLSSLPAAEARPMLLAEMGADAHTDATALSTFAHAQFAVVGFEASYLVQHDSVPVTHA